jgi:hypothetical protein
MFRSCRNLESREVERLLQDESFPHAYTFHATCNSSNKFCTAETALVLSDKETENVAMYIGFQRASKTAFSSIPVQLERHVEKEGSISSHNPTFSKTSPITTASKFPQPP